MMADHIHWAALLFSTFVLFVCDCKPLDGYKFPVYTTKSCPRNQTEWSERSSAINCTESNGYLCLPSEDLTELFEFCYFEYLIPIAKGLCMFLRKRDSFIDAYNCRNFVEGCPNSTYRIYEVYKYRSCVSIGNGCFLDDPTCVRTTATYKVTNSSRTTASVETLENTKHETNDLVWIITLLGVIVLVFIPIAMYCMKIKVYVPAKHQSYENNAENSLIGNGIEEEIDAAEDSLYQTSIYGHNIVVRRSQTINFDVDVNVCDENGLSPLYVACFKGHESTVKFLIDNGADVNLCAMNGASPFLVACRNGHDSIVRLLLNNGADEHLCAKDGYTPFHAACQSGHNNIAKFLLNKCVQK